MLNDKVKYAFVAALLGSVYWFFFFGIDDAVTKFSLMYDKVLLGEYWRLFSYQFAHIDTSHLYENMISLALIIILAIELKINANDMTSVYLLTGLLAVLPLWIFTHSTLLGASAAIYGGFAMMSLNLRKFAISPLFAIFVIILFSMIKPINLFFFGGDGLEHAFMQAVLHLCGFFFGLVAYQIFVKAKFVATKRKRECLMRVSNQQIVEAED